ncbi:DNA cytosine methyltransferase [Phormidesmis priestleyi ULC007]|uniref:Cytosine-specific methyltransferase n=1 Tax=Phormidesmis priestleyi ULC007 TaxID=1920490 RepID=A0A2T1DL27_9CYAN|nr:DNA cytosine methyltransferase [Phormidesmis priestleyi]PSB21124.1 DNA cytosine methyltransferase [Phormidesmis priestleyi ULC007]PZO51351.1 MAG: DNA cytosine methyltransferase [Phormidesmis priestleyi]
MPTFSALSLFSGAGGMDIGVRQAGFEVLACIEVDPHCCQTLRSAIEREGLKTVLFEKDIRQVDPSQLKADLGLQTGELDLLFGGSPCQSFSQAGKHGSLEDERGLLLFEFVRFAKALKPKVIVIEQVKGVLKALDQLGKVGGVCESLIGQIEELGYKLKLQIINSANYGVAQTRERVFIVATESGTCFDFPLPTHGKLDIQFSLFPIKQCTTVGEALKGLGSPSKDKDNQPEDSHIDITPAGDRRRIHGVPEGSFLARELHLPETQRCRLTKKDTTKFRRLSFSKLSLTLRCGEIFFHPIEDRYLTPREYMRIHGYPDNYFLKGPVRGRSGRVRHLDQHRQIANSVPPPVACAIAKEVLEFIAREKVLSKSSRKPFVNV